MSIERILPEPLAVLHELAADLHWSWSHASDQIWQRLNSEIWENTHNPVSVLHFTSDQTLQELAGDTSFLRELKKLVAAREQYLTTPGWYAQRYPAAPLR